MSPHHRKTVARVLAAAGVLGLAVGCTGSVGSQQNVHPDSAVDPGTDAGTGIDTGGSADTKDAASVQDVPPAVDVPPPTDAPPAPPAMLRMVFPISGVTTAATVTARGTTDGKDVAKVTVNGVAATSSDGFLTWKASVPLNSGDNTVTALMERGDQSQVQVSAAVARVASDTAIKRGKLLSGVTFSLMGGSVDSKGTAMYLADVNADGVLRIDIETGDQAWATCSEHSNPCGDGPGKGVPFTQPMDVAVDEAHQRAFVIDGQNVFAVDLTGKGGPSERTIISGPDVTDASYSPPTYAGRGSGPQAQQFGSMSYDPAANVIYAVDWGQGNNAPVGFFKIDPETGNRQVLSSIGAGGVFRQIDISPAKGVLFSTAAYQSSLTTVKLSDGTRSGGPSITEPQALAASDALGAVFAVDKSGALVAFEGSALASRSIAHLGGGPGLSVGGDLLFIYDGALAGVAAFDPQNGERIVVSR
jgi:Glucodextranase, domain B